MTVIAADPIGAEVAPGYRGLLGFCELIDEALEDRLIVRHLELRHEDEDGLRLLRVVVSEGERVHGLSSSLYRR